MGSIGALMRQSFDRGERRRLAGFFGGVGLLHIAGWGLLLAAAAGQPTILALGGLAYTFGLRHAFDADHIAAIDNTTRKLLQDGRKPVGVGFFFSLGHSTVVFIVAAALGLTVKWIVDGVAGNGGQLRIAGGILGTVVSGAFLVLIGILNLFILLDIVRVYRRLKAGGYDDQSLQLDLTAGGVMSRIFGRLFRVINHSWQMYPIGFLFGLGFDTASEVAILAISAGAAAKGLPLVAVIALPLLFAAGQMRVAPESTLYVGDDERDVQAARAAGMPVIVAGYGYLGDGTPPTAWDADGVVASAAEIGAWIREQSPERLRRAAS